MALLRCSLHRAGPASSAIDAAQFDVESCLVQRRSGVVVAIFSLVGFECATAGDEAKNPLKSIPKAVKYEPHHFGRLLRFCAYVMVMGTRAIHHARQLMRR